MLRAQDSGSGKFRPRLQRRGRPRLSRDSPLGFQPPEHGSIFTPLEIMPRCSAAGLDFRIIPAGFNAPLQFLTGFINSYHNFSAYVKLICHLVEN